MSNPLRIDKALPAPVYIHDDGSVGDRYHSLRELYAHRLMLQALLFNTWARLGIYEVHRSWQHHPDDVPMFASDDPERPYFVVVARLPTGQLSNHYRGRDKWELFLEVPHWVHAEKWDGSHGLAQGMELLEGHGLGNAVSAGIDAHLDDDPLFD